MKRRKDFCIFSMLVVFMLVGFLGVGFAKVKVSIINNSGAPAGTYTNLINRVKTKVEKFVTEDSLLAKGFAISNAYASRVAALNGYQGYDITAVMLGASLGVQMPTSDIKNIHNYIGKQIETQLDTYSGAGVSAAINVGLNAGRFGLKLFKRDLYFNLKFFYLDVNIMGMQTELVSFGVGANWQLLKPRTFGSKYLLKWRGLSIGTGLYFNRNAVVGKLAALTDIKEDGYTVDPKVEIDVQSNMAVIPIEAHTAIQLLWCLTFNAGIGVDLNIGETDIVTRTTGNVIVDIVTGPTGDLLVVDASQEGVFGRAGDMKFIVGMGLNVGPGILAHVDFTYYVVNGFCLNVSSGFVW